jgi:hypothetical protein
MSSSKPFEVRSFGRFEKEALAIIRAYPSFKNDLEAFKKLLTSNPEQGEHLGSGVFKARIEITGKPAGKSYGARVIHAVFSVAKEVLLIKVYDKSKTKDLSSKEIQEIRKLVADIRVEKTARSKSIIKP